MCKTTCNEISFHWFILFIHILNFQILLSLPRKPESFWQFVVPASTHFPEFRIESKSESLLHLESVGRHSVCWHGLQTCGTRSSDTCQHLGWPCWSLMKSRPSRLDAWGRRSPCRYRILCEGKYFSHCLIFYSIVNEKYFINMKLSLLWILKQVGLSHHVQWCGPCQVLCLW